MDWQDKRIHLYVSICRHYRKHLWIQPTAEQQPNGPVHRSRSAHRLFVWDYAITPLSRRFTFTRKIISKRGFPILNSHIK